MKHAALCCSLVAAGSIAFAASPASPRHELPAEVSRSGFSPAKSTPAGPPGPPTAGPPNPPLPPPRGLVE